MLLLHHEMAYLIFTGSFEVDPPPLEVPLEEVRWRRAGRLPYHDTEKERTTDSPDARLDAEDLDGRRSQPEGAHGPELQPVMGKGVRVF